MLNFILNFILNNIFYIVPIVGIFLISAIYSAKARSIFIAVASFVAGMYIPLHMDKLRSVGERFELWSDYDYISLENLIVGIDLYSHFGLENGWMAVVDNAYLFGFATFGVVSFIFFLFYCLKLSTKTKYLIVLSIMFVLLGLTTNIFSSRSFFTIYCLLAGIELSKDSDLNLQDKRYELFPSSTRCCKMDGYRNSINQLNT